MSGTPEQLEQTVDEPAAEDETTQSSAEDGLVVEDLLIEDVSIDGMCGVY